MSTQQHSLRRWPATLVVLALAASACTDEPMGPEGPGAAPVTVGAVPASSATFAGVAGSTTVDPAAGAPVYYLRHVGTNPPSSYSHNYQWAAPALTTPSPEDGPVVLQGTLDLSGSVVGQVAMIGLVDAADLAAGNTSFQRGAYIYVYRNAATSWRIGVSDGNTGGEIVQSFINVDQADLPSSQVLDVVFTVDGTADGSTCAVGSVSDPAGCLTLQVAGGSVNATLTDSYGDITGAASSSPEFSGGGVPGWDDYIGSMVAYDLTVPAGDAEGPVTSDVTAAPNPVAVNADYAIQALVDDAATGGSNVASAEYSLDGGLNWAPMGAADGAFDGVAEGVTATETAPTEPGLYDLDVCVRGTDAPGNLGAETCAAIQLVVYDPSGGFVTGGGWIDSPIGAMTTPGTPWSQDFSGDAAGWDDADDGWYGQITVAGGVATVQGDGTSAPFSRFDGYRDTWPGTWMAEIDVYLDPAWAAGEGFDYSVASSGSDGNHQRDFIFHVGTVEDYGPIVGKALLVNGSNNADFTTNPFKLVNDNGGDFYEVTSAGWYTLQHVFRDAGGYLAVDLNLLDGSGTVLWTATRENAADLIPAEVGGNRYSWFTHVDVTGGIQVDNHELHLAVPSPAGKANFGFVSRYKRGASTPDGNTQFTFKTGDLNFHSSSYDWLVVNQGGENAQFKGEGTINGTGTYKFMLWAGDHDDGDTFRIKIWEETGSGETVVYDNGTDQEIGGGNIVVHDGKGKK